MRYKRYAPACPLAFPSSSLAHLLPCFAEKVSHLLISPLVARLPHLPACWRKSRPVSSLLLTAHPPTLPSPSPPKSTSPCTKVTKRPSVKVIKWPSAQVSNCTTSDQLLKHSRIVIRGLIDCSLQTMQEPLNLGMVDQALRKSKSEWSCPEWISILLTMERLTCLLCKGSPPTSLSSLVHNLNSLLHNPLQCPVPFCNQVFTSTRSSCDCVLISIPRCSLELVSF